MPENPSKVNSQSFYEKLLEQVPDVIFNLVWNKENDLQVHFCSKSLEHIIEMSREDFKANPGAVLKQRIITEDYKLFLASVQLSKEKLTPWDFEFRVMLPEKGLRWLRVFASPEVIDKDAVAFYGRISDITALKEQEIWLKNYEKRTTHALEAASEGIWDFDMVTNTVYFSAQTMKIIGMEEKEAVVPVDFWIKRIYEPDRAGHQKAREDYLEGTVPRFESVYRMWHEKGYYIWILSQGRVVARDAVTGKATRSIGALKDISSIKEKEIELGKTITIIGDQNNRLNNFAHIVSHNLRSHAGNLKMFIDIFKNVPEEERDEMLTQLEAISNSLSITIGHLKELVEIQSEVKIVKEKLNIRHYLKNILNILQNEIKKHNVRTEINIPLDATISYNPAYLESILLNFTTNAIKYSSPERKLVISYDYEETDGKKALSISDNGLGIDLKRHRNSLFGMYKTFHKHQNSRGIGLFITKNQVEAMGGEIEVTSEVGQGTTFKIFFNEKD